MNQLPRQINALAWHRELRATDFTLITNFEVRTTYHKDIQIVSYLIALST